VTDLDQWMDYVYFSSKPYGTDQLLGAFPHTGALKRDESYVQVKEVLVPERISGQYYITVKTDALNNIFEFTFDTPVVRRIKTATTSVRRSRRST